MSIRASVEDLDDRLERNYEALEGGSLDPLDLAPRIKSLREERDQLTARLVNVQERTGKHVSVPKPEQVAEALEDFRALLESGTIEERKGVVRGFIKEVR